MFQFVDRLLARRLDHGKLALIREAYSRGARSFADLGGVWRVDGGYSFYAERLGYRGILVDTHPTDAALNRTGKSVEFLRGNFGDPAIVESVRGIDAVFFFDVLLHQVRPDWDELLRLYSWAPMVLIYNQQWTGSDTVRLLDLGETEYFANTPHDPNEPTYKNLFQKIDTPHPDHGGRLWRDVHHIWQWGITDEALIGRMGELGYKLDYSANHGSFGRLPRFENHSFLFLKGRQ